MLKQVQHDNKDNGFSMTFFGLPRSRWSLAMTARKKAAFTLAEVLITLMIIGVIAMITIPALQKNIEKRILKTQILSAQSIITQAIQRSIVDNGHTSTWGHPITFNHTHNLLVPYLSPLHVCGNGSIAIDNQSHDCFIPDTGNGHWLRADGSSTEGFGGGYGAGAYHTMKLKNGMSLGIWGANQNKNIRPGSATVLDAWIMHFMVDVNGKNGPTKYGQDVFSFTLDLDTGRLIPDEATKNIIEN